MEQFVEVVVVVALEAFATRPSRDRRALSTMRRTRPSRRFEFAPPYASAAGRSQRATNHLAARQLCSPSGEVYFLRLIGSRFFSAN